MRYHQLWSVWDVCELYSVCMQPGVRWQHILLPARMLGPRIMQCNNRHLPVQRGFWWHRLSGAAAANATCYSGTLQFNATAVQPSGPGITQLSLVVPDLGVTIGTANYAPCSNASASFSWDTAAATNVSYCGSQTLQVQAIATDTCGVSNNVTTNVTFHLDNHDSCADASTCGVVPGACTDLCCSHTCTCPNTTCGAECQFVQTSRAPFVALSIPSESASNVVGGDLIELDIVVDGTGSGTGVAALNATIVDITVAILDQPSLVTTGTLEIAPNGGLGVQHASFLSSWNTSTTYAGVRCAAVEIHVNATDQCGNRGQFVLSPVYVDNNATCTSAEMSQCRSVDVAATCTGLCPVPLNGADDFTCGCTRNAQHIFAGAHCNITTCIANTTCNGHGQCNTVDGSCICNAGFSNTNSSSSSSSTVTAGPDFGRAAGYAVLAAGGVSNTGSTVVVAGDVGSSPTGTIIGFPPGTLTAGTLHSTADAATANARTDASAVYLFLQAQTCTDSQGVTDIGGTTMTPGVHCYTSSLAITGAVTLDAQGNTSARFIFKTGSTLTTASSASIVLVNGTQSCNVFFVVGSSATIGTSTTFIGNILADTSITFVTSATTTGRVFAGMVTVSGAVTFDTNSVATSSAACITTGSTTAAAACSTCSASYFGYPTCTFCQASTTCHGHGQCNTTDGSCVCATGFDPATACGSCLPNFYGFPAGCTFCNANTTCSGNGQCNTTDGSCICDPSYSGAACDACSASHYGYPTCTFCQANTTCSGNGQCDTNDGSCICNAGFATPSCSTCAASFYYGYPTCTFCNASTTCSGHGQCNTTDATCVCNAGYSGLACNTCAANFYGYPQQCTFCLASTTCSGHGQCNTADGSCVCNSTFAGAACSTCAADRHVYPTCTFCQANTTCSGHGQCNATDASCVCNAGFVGAACNTCGTNDYDYPLCTFCLASTTCETHGYCNVTDGSCICNAGFTGTDCDRCSASYYGFPQCQFCDTNSTCGGALGWGQCNTTDGSCTCSAAYAGPTCAACSTSHYGFPQCTFCDTNSTCNGASHGQCNTTDGSCICTTNFAGPSCSSCSANQYGLPNCDTFCLAATTCSGHGQCNTTDGTCVCDAGFTGAACGTCAANYYNYPQCTFCLANSTCNGHGQCNGTGACDCTQPQYAGTNCTACSASGFYFNYPTCVFCNASTTCSGRGQCSNTTGQCVCNLGYNSTACAQPTVCGTLGGICQNGATCTSPAPGQYQCAVCPAHCSGAMCDVCDVCLDAQLQPRCKNGATCVALSATSTAFQCVCPAPYSGPNCDQLPPADVCADPALNPCTVTGQVCRPSGLSPPAAAHVCVAITSPSPTLLAAHNLGNISSPYNHSVLSTCSPTTDIPCVPGSGPLSLFEHLEALDAASDAAHSGLLIVSQNMSLCWNDRWSFVRLQVLSNTSTNLQLQNCLWDMQIGYNSPPSGQHTITAGFLPFRGRTRNRLSVASSSVHQLMTSLSPEEFVLNDAGSANSHTFTFSPSPNPTSVVSSDPATLTVTTTDTVSPLSIWAAINPSVLPTVLNCMGTKTAAQWATCV